MAIYQTDSVVKPQETENVKKKKKHSVTAAQNCPGCKLLDDNIVNFHSVMTMLKYDKWFNSFRSTDAAYPCMRVCVCLNPVVSITPLVNIPLSEDFADGAFYM